MGERRNRWGWSSSVLVAAIAVAVFGVATRNLVPIILASGMFVLASPIPRLRSLLLSAIVLTVGIAVASVVAASRDEFAKARPSIAFLSVFAIVGFISYGVEVRQLRKEQGAEG